MKSELVLDNDMVGFVCPVCGKEFSRHKGFLKPVKYARVCSRNCIYKGRTMGIIKREVKKPYNTFPITRFTKNCLVCGKEFETTPSRVKDGRGKYCGRRCYEISKKENMKGEKNFSWVDGRSYNKKSFRGNNWEEIRKQVYERDNYTCQNCNRKCIGRRDLRKSNSDRLIQCHHIKPYESEEDNNLDNLQTLCARCHAEIINMEVMA